MAVLRAEFFIDNIRPYMPFSHVQLLNLTDPHYLVKAQARYKNKLLKNSFMFITSVLSPQELWAGFHLDRADDRDRSDNAKVMDSPDSSTQLFRRLSEIWEVTETSVCIRKYKDGHFQMVGSFPNPVPSYLAQHPDTRGETLQSSAVFQKIQDKYTPDSPVQLSLFEEDDENLPFS